MICRLGYKSEHASEYWFLFSSRWFPMVVSFIVALFSRLFDETIWFLPCGRASPPGGFFAITSSSSWSTLTSVTLYTASTIHARSVTYRCLTTWSSVPGLARTNVWFYTCSSITTMGDTYSFMAFFTLVSWWTRTSIRGDASSSIHAARLTCGSLASSTRVPRLANTYILPHTCPSI